MWKILLFCLIFASLLINFVISSSDEKVKRESQKKINDFVMKFNKKLDYLSDRVDRLETKRNEAIDAREIIANISRLIFESNENVVKKIEKVEERFNKMEKLDEKNDKNFEKFNENFEKIDKNFEKNDKKFDENLEKSEKVEAKLVGMESILLQLKNASEDVNRGRSDDVWRGVRSLCEDKVATWANATSIQMRANLDRIDFCIRNEQKALNACNTKPCLHGGRCSHSSTGSGYECECPKFRSGRHCENVECSAEKRCFRFKDSMYVVIEPKIIWAEAKVKCEGLNMTLAMPKDEERTQFLRSQLRPIYTKYPYERLWIGLKRDEGMSTGQWAWVDGSALVEYTGGNDYMKGAAGSLFGVLYVDNGSVRWGWVYATHQLYSICETRFSTN